jgi:hypothetical protein
MNDDEEGRFTLILFLVIGWFYVVISRIGAVSGALTRWSARGEERGEPVAHSMAFCQPNRPATVQSVKESVTTLD